MAAVEPMSWESPNVIRRDLLLPGDLERALVDFAAERHVTPTQVIWDAIDCLSRRPLRIADLSETTSARSSKPVVERSMMMPAEKEGLVLESATACDLEPTKVIWLTLADYLEGEGVVLNGARESIANVAAPAG
jgi:hypothetical protein